jgi:hypothetical protein
LGGRDEEVEALVLAGLLEGGSELRSAVDLDASDREGARRLPKGLKPPRPGELVQVDTLFVNVARPTRP